MILLQEEKALAISIDQCQVKQLSIHPSADLHSLSNLRLVPVIPKQLRTDKSFQAMQCHVMLRTQTPKCDIIYGVAKDFPELQVLATSTSIIISIRTKINISYLYGY